MDSYLLTFLYNTPERAVPFPWERTLDLRLNMLCYRNDFSNALVADLRSRVNLGGGLFYESSLWNTVTGSRTIEHSRYCHINRKYDHDHPFVIQPNCCCGPFLFLVVPEPIWCCPICAHPFPLFY